VENFWGASLGPRAPRSVLPLTPLQPYQVTSPVLASSSLEMCCGCHHPRWTAPRRSPASQRQSERCQFLALFRSCVFLLPTWNLSPSVLLSFAVSQSGWDEHCSSLVLPSRENLTFSKSPDSHKNPPKSLSLCSVTDFRSLTQHILWKVAACLLRRRGQP